MTLTVACVRVTGKGKRKYPLEYVLKLQSMVKRHLDRPFRMVCLTDQPEELPPDILGVKVKKPKRLRGWWTKIRLFDPAMPFAGRVLYLDLDVLVTGSLGEIVDYPADFAIVPDQSPSFKGARGMPTVKGYNSSVMVWDHRARRQIYERWTSDIAGRLWSDQDHIKLVCPKEKTMPPEWFDRYIGNPPKPGSKVMLCVKTKNHQIEHSWFHELWR